MQGKNIGGVYETHNTMFKWGTTGEERDLGDLERNIPKYVGMWGLYIQVPATGETGI